MWEDPPEENTMALSDLIRRVSPGRANSTAVRAVWNGVVLAESDDTVYLEGNHYFPRESLRDEYFRDSADTSICPWKGKASYLTVEVEGRRNEGAAWFYPKPSPAAGKIEDRVAFWRGVQIEDV
jgi:uncharacterized protein (DUF427 family)